MDFINYKSDTSGGRLARWLQTDSFVDVNKCEVIFPRAKIKCGWPTSLAVVTRDQYGDIVEVPDLKVKVMCTLLSKEYTSKDKSEDGNDGRKPNVFIPYKPTVINKVRYNAIAFMKEYSRYSFEEIRYMTLTTTSEGECLSIHANHNGIYTVNWTPKEIGIYSISVSIDGYRANKLDSKIEVKTPPFGLAPPVYNKSNRVSYVEKKLKFSKKFSLGLRIRVQPSLQSEQIGVVSPNGIVTYIDKAENEDGVWIKLTHECITQYCREIFPEAWCLRYNKHYESELLSVVDNQTNDELLENVITDKDIKVYQVVKCGVSGHNLRSSPTLKAPTVGMVFAEQKVTSDEQIYNKEGMWIKLDNEARKKYKVNQYDTVWSLAIDKSQIVYLRSDFSINKELFLKALKWDNVSFKIAKSESLCTSSSSTNSEDSDNDHNHNYFTRTNQKKLGSEFKDDSLYKKHRSCRNNKNVTHGSKRNFVNDFEDDEIIEIQATNDQNVNFNIPPTPKKKRNTMQFQKPEVSLSLSDSSESSSAVSSKSTSPQMNSFIDKLEKKNEFATFVISSISHSSGGISTSSHGYQASIDTSSDSAIILEPNVHYTEEKRQPLLAQTGTQTSPKMYQKTGAERREHINYGFTMKNVNIQNESTRKSCHLYETENIFEISKTPDEDNKLKMEKMISSNTTNISDIFAVEDMDSNDDVSSNDDDEKMVEIVKTKNFRKYATKCYGISDFSNLVKNENEIFNLSDEKLDHDENYQQFTSHVLLTDSSHVNDNFENTLSSKGSKIQYKTGVSPSVAESIRAVFAAFLWHEDLVHDAMTCASFLKFHPELQKGNSVVVRRENIRKIEASQRHSVEVGLTGNDHHIMKPSTMKSLPTSNKNYTSEVNEIDESKNTSKTFPLTLECIVTLWSKISNTCFKLFSKNIKYTAQVIKSYTNEKDFKNSISLSDSEDSKKNVPKLASDFYKRFGSEEMCELCNGKYPFPVTYHMRNVHKGCGKNGASKGYAANGKYTVKLKGNCGDGGKKTSPWYLLCDTCREQYLEAKKLKKTFSGFSPINDECVPVNVEAHLIMKENALFALDLSGSYSKIMPAFMALPKLKSFACLPSFGIDGDVIPSEVNSFTAETKNPNKSEDNNVYEDSENEINSVHRSMSTTGKSSKFIEDDNRTPPSIPNKRYSAVLELLENSNSSAMCKPSIRLQNVLKNLKNSTSESENEVERPIMVFLSEYHNLQSLRSAMKLIIKKAIFKNYGLRAFDWLLRTVTTPIALHDIMWWFVSSVSIPLQTNDNYYESDNEWNDEFDLTRICEHPLVDMTLAGEIRQHLPSSFHTLLQTIADLMMIFPVGSPLQQMAIKCWGFQFTHSDYNFLHRSKLFVNISKILSRSESEEEQETNNASVYESHLSSLSKSGHYVEVLRDITSFVSMTVSSQAQLVQNLIDNSTETYWESGEDDRRKVKTIMLHCQDEADPYIIYVHIDNTRDTNHKVFSLMILTGTHVDDPHKLKMINLDSDYCGWVTTFIPETNQRVIRIDCKGDNSIRIRQIKVTGKVVGESPKILQQLSSFVLQQRQCESETLKVFRLIIFQVFGELIETFQSNVQRNADQRERSDMKEHMVGILFSRRKLNDLQKQVCSHVVQAIKKETSVIKEEWEKHTNLSHADDHTQCDINDSYCFEMLCMVSALSGSSVGRSYLARQFDLISDLLTLLHVGTNRLQRQVVLLLRRVLPEVSPEMLAKITGIKSLPVIDFRTLINTVASSLDSDKRGILDIFLAVTAKTLCMQVKTKNGNSGKEMKSVVISDCIRVKDVDSRRWYMKGSISKELAGEIDALLKDMSTGKISENWKNITKAAIAECILNLTKLGKITKDHNQCLKYPTFWIGLSSLSSIDKEHVEKLSSANWRNEEDEVKSPRPMCNNHDDGKTLAVMQCNVCGLLCLECDRFLHLNKKTNNHERQVCKEEEEAIKVDLHEGCGRVKLYWLLALVDSNTFKGVVEFRENARLSNAANRNGFKTDVCRFCSRSSDKLTDNGICYDEECFQHAHNVCNKIHGCGHICGGINDEEKCLVCLHSRCSSGNSTLKQDADDMCMICFTEALSAAPSIQLECGHVFHYHCCESVLLKRWQGPRITFNFQQCPICKRSIYHVALKELLSPIWDLMKDVRKKAAIRLEYEGCQSTNEDPALYAIEKYAYYVCFKCKKAYYGGEARCEAEVDRSEFNPEELICGGCSDISGARVCSKHGTDFLEYKCRYCCSVAVYFCFGTTHFCNTCHEDFQKVISMLPSELPKCPAGPKGISLNVEDCPLHIKHPPTGEEFALGCGVCRTGRNF